MNESQIVFLLVCAGAYTLANVYCAIERYQCWCQNQAVREFDIQVYKARLRESDASIERSKAETLAARALAEAQKVTAESTRAQMQKAIETMESLRKETP